MMTLRTSRRTFLTAATVALTLGLAPVAHAAQKVRIGVISLTSHSAGFIAYEKGYFAKQGLDPELVMFQAAGPMAIAIASGDIDFGVTAITGALLNLADKGAVKVIGGAMVEEKGIEGQKILVSKKAYDAGVTTPAKLKGHSFALTGTGSSFHYMISKVAEKEGFSVKDMRLKPLQKVGAIIGALQSGQVDAWAIQPHIAVPLDKSGAAKIIGNISDYIPNYQVTTIFTSAKIAADKPDFVKKFLAGYSEGIADFNAAMVDKTAGQEALDKDVEIIHKYVYSSQPLEKAAPSIKAGAMRLQPGAHLNMASVKDQVDWFHREGLVKASATVDKLVDPQYVETVE